MRGQSLVEFALASVVLVLLFGGLVDLTRAIHYADVLQNAVREGARQGAAFDPAKPNNPSFDTAHITTIVDAQLNAGGLPSSIAGAGCPSVADGNLWHNPPYPSSVFPVTANQPKLYVCYDNLSGTPPATFTNPERDLNVILVMAYGPLTAAVPTPLGGNLGLTANWHIRVQGG